MLLGLVLSLLLSILPVSADLTTAATPAVTPVAALAFTQGVQKTVLDNGLTVLTKEVHTAPVVSVQVWYKVGSRNEGKGESGISHQLEHLMFKGTTSRPVQFGRLFSALGSQFNAFTSFDETAYYGTVQRDKLEALLTLESDRMIHALINPEQLESEKRVVISELQGYENSPEYRLDRAVRRAAFPQHPYGLPIGGTKADVENFTVEQVRNYYQTYYSPENATLVVTGDFDTNQTLSFIKQTFGKVPNRKAAKFVPKITTTPTSQKNPIILKQPGSTALLQAVYPLPNINHPDVPAIDVMDLILTGGRSSRLYQAVVESGLASAVSASPIELTEPGWYEVSATAAPGQDVEKIAQVIQATFSKLQQEAVSSAELNRAKTQLQAYFVLNNQDITSQASQLAYSQTIAGDYHYIEKYLGAIAQVTPQDIQRVAKLYLDPKKQTIGFFEPTTIADNPETAAVSGRVTEKFDPGVPVDPAELAKYLPAVKSSNTVSQQPIPQQFTLTNGLKVLLLRDSSVPTINLSGQINAGTVFDDQEKAGLASLTADNLLNGTKTQDALSIAQALEDRGASLDFSAGREGVTISGQGLSTNLPLLVQTLADVLQNATFPADQLELSRQRAITSLKSHLDDPRTLGRQVFQQTIYPKDHPFHNFPTLESLQRISRDDVVGFYKSHYRPDTMTISLVGDFEPSQVKALFNQAFAQWRVAGEVPSINLPSVSFPGSQVRVNTIMTGKAEAVTYLGYNGISRKDPRYYAALVLNQILGGDTLSSRLGTEIRDRLGLTYGIYSGFAAGINPGPFLISMQTSPQDAPKAISSTIALLQQIRNQGITESELRTAKRSLTNSYPVELASSSEVASIVLNNAILGLSPEEIRTFPQRIQAVTMNDIQQVIADLIKPENLVIVTAGPEVK